MYEVRTTERSKPAVMGWAETVGLVPVGERVDGISVYIRFKEGTVNTVKSVRAAGFTGISLLIGSLLLRAGLPAEFAYPLVPVLAGFIDVNYRLLRGSNTWIGRYLTAIDPPSGTP